MVLCEIATIRVDSQLLKALPCFWVHIEFYISQRKGGITVKKAILPLGLAVVMLIIFLNVNKEPGAAGYILSVGMGLGLGAILNNFIFRKSKDTSNENEPA